MKKLKEQVEHHINKMIEQGLQITDVQTLGELVDIHKDLANEEYWEKKEEVMQMRYRGYEGYGEYGNESYGRRGVPGSGRGRYREGGSMGAGSMGRRYRGEEMMGEMMGAYQAYSEGKEEFNMGNYGAKSDTMKSLDYMMRSVVEFIEMLKKDASSQEELKIIQEYTKQISEM